MLYEQKCVIIQFLAAASRNTPIPPSLQRSVLAHSHLLVLTMTLTLSHLTHHPGINVFWCRTSTVPGSEVRLGQAHQDNPWRKRLMRVECACRVGSARAPLFPAQQRRGREGERP